MSIELPSSLKALDIARTSRDKNRVLQPQTQQDDVVASEKVSIIRLGDSDSLNKAATYSQQTSSALNNTLNEKQAISAYQSVEKEQQRQGIQLLLGVDTFV